MARLKTVPKKKQVQTKYIFVIGGVMSGVGKGITTSSMGQILQSKGFSVTLMKADPYLNVDAGTMNPTEHGEVFVLDSGLETDQDMGNYERFLNVDLPSENYMTNGMVFQYVINKERALGFHGKCVEPTFHITEEILRRINSVIKKENADIVIVEIGGTVGEYQNAIFLEAARQIKMSHPQDAMFVLVSYLPTPAKIGEMKTKPTQNAIRQMNSYGVTPDMVILRSEGTVDAKRKEKIARFSGILVDNVIPAPDVESIYEVPVNFEKGRIGERILNTLHLSERKKDGRAWRAMVKKLKNSKKKLKIAMVGKYFDTGEFVLSDAYISVIEAIKFSAGTLGAKAQIDWVNSKSLNGPAQTKKRLAQYDGIIVPGGFGETGIDGKLHAIQYARENKVPYLGLCYGMQLMVVEYARNVAGLKDAHTTEINPKTEHPVVCIMDEQKKKLKDKDMGGSMRLGGYPAVLASGTIARKAYGKAEVRERHRHRYEVNPVYVEQLKQAGLVFSGTSPNGVLMEIAELKKDVHPFMVGTQFHPEFLARPLAPHPLFTEFIRATLAKK